ncbi:hypothetical protein N665_0852s0005 [Sinapis alba]|nr:hypothetical protein N665_0852s0005 [Sinapis alba]
MALRYHQNLQRHIGININRSAIGLQCGIRPGPFTFRIQGQSHHRIGSLIPSQGRLPKYIQLYIFDTNNEVSNQLKAMGQTSTEGKLDETTVKRLIEMIDKNNCLAKVFRRSCDYYETNPSEEFNIRLVPDKQKGEEYDLPSTSEVTRLMTLQQIHNDHPLYMSLKYPLMFPYGEYGFHPEIQLNLETGTSKTRQFLSIHQYYASQIQTRLNQRRTLIKGGRILHQYVVDVYTKIEEDRLRWARNNQDVLRAELYSNVLDAVTKGDTDAKLIGQRFILPPSFTGYVLYRRRRDETAFVVKDGAVMNNTSVIPHNIDILKKYEAHIKFEWCNRTSAVKYMFKYITKGVDKATDVLEKGNSPSASNKGNETINKQRNEIHDFIDCRYLSACESMWRIIAYHIHKRKPTVQKLIIHLEGEHNITIKETDDLERVIRKPWIKETMLTEWMVLCRRSEFARTLTYMQNPEYFVWNNGTKVWSERKKGVQIGRVVTVHQMIAII